MSKDVGSAPSLTDFNTAMSSRYTDDEPSTSTSPPSTEQQPPEKPAMTRRSWLLPTEVGTDFAEAANRIHHGSGGRISKSEAQAALIRAGLEREEEIARKLGASGATDRT